MGPHLESEIVKKGHGKDIPRMDPCQKYDSAFSRNEFEDLLQQPREQRFRIANALNRGSDLSHRIGDRFAGADFGQHISIDAHSLDGRVAHRAGTITQLDVPLLSQEGWDIKRWRAGVVPKRNPAAMRSINVCSNPVSRPK